MSQKYIASVSFGKDSLAMLLLLIEKQYPLDEVVFYDTGKEFQAIYNLRDKIKPLLESKGIIFTELYPKNDFDYDMFERPKKKRTGEMVRGDGWCGGACRWGTFKKMKALDDYTKGNHVYIGLAVEETQRLERMDKNKTSPLAEWDMTERDCLEYCYLQGYNWDENGAELYTILDRVSCWCCRNKNLKELKGIYQHLPDYWQKLKDIQMRLPEPMKKSGSIFELEERFERELMQTEL